MSTLWSIPPINQRVGEMSKTVRFALDGENFTLPTSRVLSDLINYREPWGREMSAEIMKHKA